METRKSLYHGAKLITLQCQKMLCSTLESDSNYKESRVRIGHEFRHLLFITTSDKEAKNYYDENEVLIFPNALNKTNIEAERKSSCHDSNIIILVLW